MQLLRHIPFWLTVILTLLTLAFTVQVIVWDPNDLSYLFENFEGDIFTTGAALQVVVGDDIAIRINERDDDLPQFVLAGSDRYLTGMNWHVFWQEDHEGLVEATMFTEVFRVETATAALLDEDTDMGEHEEDEEDGIFDEFFTEFDDEVDFEQAEDELLLPLAPLPERSFFVEFEQPIVAVGDEHVPIRFERAGYHSVIMLVDVEVEHEEVHDDWDERDTYSAELFYDVIALPPVTELPTDDMLERHSARLESARPAALLLDWWAWGEHPCAVADVRGIDYVEHLCDDVSYVRGLIWELIEALPADEETSPQTAALLHQAGLLAVVQEDSFTARQSFRQAAVLHGIHGETLHTAAALHNLAIVLHVEDDTEQAESVLHQSFSLRPPESEIGRLLSAAQIYTQWGNRGSALAAAHALASRGLPQADALIDWLENEM